MLAHADVLLRQGLPGPALEMYTRALQEAGQAELYQNYWIPMRDLQGRLNDALKQLLGQQEFEAALSLLDAAESLSPPEAQTIARAETHEAWGAYLESRAGRRVRSSNGTCSAARGVTSAKREPSIVSWPNCGMPRSSTPWISGRPGRIFAAGRTTW